MQSIVNNDSKKANFGAFLNMKLHKEQQSLKSPIKSPSRGQTLLVFNKLKPEILIESEPSMS